MQKGTGVSPAQPLSLDLLRKLEHPRGPGSTIPAQNYLLYVFETAILNALLGSSPPASEARRERGSGSGFSEALTLL